MESKYHSEKSMGAPSSPAADSSNESTLPTVGLGGVPIVPNMGNPMMPMSGGAKVVGGMGELDSKNLMMSAMGGSKPELPSVAQVIAKNPQGKKSAPLAGKLRSKKYSDGDENC